MDLARWFEDKKYMWDGKSYPDEKLAQEVTQKYQEEGFMTRLFSEENQFYVFTRREVIEAKPDIG